QRFKHQTDNHAGKNREVIPCMLRQPRRRGDESDNDHHHNRRKMLPREFHCANLSSLRVNLLRVTSGNGDLSVQVSAPTLNLKPDTRNLEPFFPSPLDTFLSVISIPPTPFFA